MKRHEVVLAGDLVVPQGSEALMVFAHVSGIEVLELNRRAHQRLRSIRELAVVPGATHLFEEPGTLVEVARLPGRWFDRHLRLGGGHDSAMSRTMQHLRST